MYEVKRNGSLRPLAMFTGEVSGLTRAGRDIYEATYLSVALKDIENSTPQPMKLKLLGNNTARRRRQARPLIVR